MKSKHECFEIREVLETDEFATYLNLGFIAPVKVRFLNDWKFCFAQSFSDATIPFKFNDFMSLFHSCGSKKLIVSARSKNEKSLYC